MSAPKLKKKEINPQERKPPHVNSFGPVPRPEPPRQQPNARCSREQPLRPGPARHAPDYRRSRRAGLAALHLGLPEPQNSPASPLQRPAFQGDYESQKGVSRSLRFQPNENSKEAPRPSGSSSPQPDSRRNRRLASHPP